MKYSAKLKYAMEQIKSILKEHDIAGFVVLHTPGFSEYVNHLDTSYSCASITTEGIKFRLKQSEVGKEKAKELAEGTYNMIAHFSDVIGPYALMYMNGHDAFKEMWDGKDFPGSHSSHEEQMN